MVAYLSIATEYWTWKCPIGFVCKSIIQHAKKIQWPVFWCRLEFILRGSVILNGPKEVRPGNWLLSCPRLRGLFHLMYPDKPMHLCAWGYFEIKFTQKGVVCLVHFSYSDCFCPFDNSSEMSSVTTFWNIPSPNLSPLIFQTLIWFYFFIIYRILPGTGLQINMWRDYIVWILKSYINIFNIVVLTYL